MTNEELNAKFAEMAHAVSRVAIASEQGIQALERSHLRTLEELGELAKYLRQVSERQERYEQKHDREMQELRQRQVESDQRFEIILQEIRYLTRQQRPPQSESESG